jgi:hypothetical protein
MFLHLFLAIFEVETQRLVFRDGGSEVVWSPLTSFVAG